MAMTFAFETGVNDIFIKKDGTLALVMGVMEVKQRVYLALLHYYQEYFLNVPGGTPWFELILGSKDLQEVGIVLRTVITAVPGVISIVDFSTAFVNRALQIRVALEVAGDSGPEVVDVFYSQQVR